MTFSTYYNIISINISFIYFTFTKFIMIKFNFINIYIFIIF